MSSPPKIAIVGRPNVGKSTLYNRLTGSRSALVSDIPGLTRDRRTGAARIDGHAVELIDTAGLEEARSGSIAARMRAQTEAAVAEADLVLFVIDARDGVTPADKAFATIVRTAGKPTILVANKCEGRAAEDGLYEAYALGLGEPLAISAEHGLGLAVLAVDVAAALGLRHAAAAGVGASARKGVPSAPDDGLADNGDPTAGPASRRPIRVAIVGRPNAGKSTLINALIGDDRMITGPEPGLTRDSIASDVEIGGRPVRLFDTAGLRRKAKIDDLAEKLSAGDAVRAIRFAEVVVVVIDAERPFEHQDLTIADMVSKEGRALVIAVNKWDLVGERQAEMKRLHETVRSRLAQVPGVPLVPISALGETGLDKLTAAVFKAYETWNRRIATAALNRWLAEAVARHMPPAVAGRRIKLRYMTQASARPPTFVVFCSRPDGLPKSYVRYLANGLRETFGLPGVPVRMSLRAGENPYAPRGDRRRRKARDR